VQEARANLHVAIGASRLGPLPADRAKDNRSRATALAFAMAAGALVGWITAGFVLRSSDRTAVREAPPATPASRPSGIPLRNVDMQADGWK
jgi:hypothetical protein